MLGKYMYIVVEILYQFVGTGGAKRGLINVQLYGKQPYQDTNIINKQRNSIIALPKQNWLGTLFMNHYTNIKNECVYSLLQN